MPTSTILRSGPVDSGADFHGACEKSARAIISAIRRTTAKEHKFSAPLDELTHNLADVIEQTANLLLAGKAVRIVEDDETLTTQQAADLLNVSRPYLVRLLDSGAIPQLPKAGRHRRVARSAIMAYRHQRDTERAEALAELAAFSQTHGMGY